MVDESVDILSSVYSEEDKEMSIDDLFSKAFDCIDNCRERVENIDRIHAV